MIEKNDYCIDILNQTKAVKNALVTVETKILETHLNECVKESIKNPKNADKKIDVDLSKGKVLIAYNNSQEIKFDDIKEKILINGQNAIDMTIINL